MLTRLGESCCSPRRAMNVSTGSTQFSPKNPIFLNFQPQNNPQKCNKVLPITWLHSNIISVQSTSLISHNHAPTLNPNSHNFPNFMLNSKSKMHNLLLLKDNLTLTWFKMNKSYSSQILVLHSFSQNSGFCFLLHVQLFFLIDFLSYSTQSVTSLFLYSLLNFY